VLLGFARVLFAERADRTPDHLLWLDLESGEQKHLHFASGWNSGLHVIRPALDGVSGFLLAPVNWSPLSAQTEAEFLAASTVKGLLKGMFG